MERAVGLSPRIKRLERKADSRTRSRTEVKKAWNVVNTSLRVVKALHLSNAIKNDVHLLYSNNSVRNSHRSESVSIRNTNRGIFYSKIMAVWCKNEGRHLNVECRILALEVAVNILTTRPDGQRQLCLLKITYTSIINMILNK
jgi:hypothetical protein